MATAYGWVYTPADVLEPVLAETVCGAESVPRKNLGESDVAAWRRAVRSKGVLAT
jgi:hypothetical protein